MTRMSDFEHREVLGVDGGVLGTVKAVLFHPREPRVVGVEVAPPRALHVFERRPRYVLLGELRYTSDALRMDHRTLPEDAVGEKALGYSWQATVVWRGMDVRSARSDHIGVVHDVELDPSDGSVTRLIITTGALGDAAHGTLRVPGASITGFDGADVVVLPGFDEIESTGGAARVAAQGVLKAKGAVRSAGDRIDAAGDRLGDAAVSASYTAARAVGRSFRSGLGRKAMDKVKSLMEDDG